MRVKKTLCVRHNVLLSARALGTNGVYYEGHPALPDTWYSTLVQFDAAAGSPRTHAYKFVCTNNCNAEGITRRNIGIVFTLEHADGRVVGRHVIGAKACACPARDRGKDERAAGVAAAPDHAAKTKKRAAPTTRPGKKVKLEAPDPADDDELIDFPEVQVVGVRTVLAGLETMLRMQEQAGVAAAHARPRAAAAALREKIHYYKQMLQPVDI